MATKTGKAKTKLSIEAELLKATGEEPIRKKEKRPAYISRVVKAANDLEDKDFDNLSEAAQDFLNDCVGANDKGKPFPDFPGAATAAADDDDDAEDEDDEESDDESEDEEEDDADDETEEDDEEDDADEKPAKKPGKKKPAADEDDADDDEDGDEEDDDDKEPEEKAAKKPGKKKPAAEPEDDDEDEDDEPEEKPAKKAAPATPAKPTAEELAAKKAAIAYVRRLVIKKPGRAFDSVTALLTKKEMVLDEKLAKIIFSDAAAVINMALELGYEAPADE